MPVAAPCAQRRRLFFLLSARNEFFRDLRAKRGEAATKHHLISIDEHCLLFSIRTGGFGGLTGAEQARTGNQNGSFNAT
jgi:hypothetical protein